MNFLVYFLVLLSLACALTPRNVTYSNQVTGRTKPFRHESGVVKVVTRFLGIPYAKPPVGDLRFKPPVDMPMASNYSALAYKPACPQTLVMKRPLMNRDPVYRPDIFSEDCLYLDIYVPGSEQPTYQRPVMVWIHGGGFYHGGGSEYDSSRIASEGDVVVVNINYRLGILGFLPGSETVTLGLQDQVSALRWVNKHISKFGGDPDHVTIFGQSAGAVSVALLTVSPRARGLFKYAISQSGTLHSPWFNYGDDTVKAFDQKVKEMCGDGVSGVECFKTTPAMDLVKLYNQMRGAGAFLTPNVDGKFVMEGFQNDSAYRYLPTERYIMGFNTNDGSLVAQTACAAEHGGWCHYTAGITAQSVHDYIARDVLNMEEVRTVIKQYNTWYPAPKTNDMNMKAAGQLATDLGYRLATNRTATIFSRWMARRQGLMGKAIFVYEFNLSSSEYGLVPPGWSDDAEHGEDLMYVFGFANREKNAPPARKIVKLWTDFAKGFAPYPYWPRFEPSRPAYLYMSHDQNFHIREPVVDIRKDTFWSEWYKHGIFGKMTTTSTAPGFSHEYVLGLILTLICIVWF